MPELTLAKRHQMEAIKLIQDWSKWVVTIETAATAGIFTVLKELSKLPESSPVLRACAVASSLLLLGAVISFIVSIHYAGQLLFSLPGIVEQLPRAHEESINEMKDEYMNADILTYERRQFKLFVAGLAFVAVAAAVIITQNLLR
ncbi:MAG TPA: hypothetical protein VK752_14175 [Bryobacteraceae bacterium]|jgi:hypothetical protein|nr:hypothetical protein [Bryobacteraceae bacterium]